MRCSTPYVTDERRDPRSTRSEPAGRSDPPLRGRDRELAAIGQIVATVAGGRARVLIIDGPLGIGKTRLLEETMEVARRNGFRAALGRPPFAGTSMPLGPLLSALFEGRHALLSPGALRRLSTPSDQSYWLVHELQVLIERAAREQPVVIAIDDLQGADPETLVAIARASVGLRDSPVLWALAATADGPSGDLQRAVDQLQHDGAVRMQLSRLDALQTAQVAGSLLGAEPPGAIAQIASRAGGNPFLLVETLLGLIDEGMPDQDATALELRVPRRLRDAMRRRLDRMDADTGRLLRVASILGRFSIEHAAAMLDVSPATLLAPAQAALTADVLHESDGYLAFTHDLMREAVEATIPDPIRRSVRRQAADVLLACGADGVIAANHLAASAHRGDRRAVEGLRDAARELGAAEPARAADLGMRALELTSEDDPVWPVLVAETVLLLQATLRDDDADALAAIALAGSLAPDDEAEIRLSLATLSRRPVDARAEQSRQALALDGISPALRAGHRALLVQNLALAGRLADASALLEPARAAVVDAGDDLASASLLLAEIEIRAAQGRHDRVWALVHDSPGRSRSVAGRAALGAIQMARARALAAAGDLDGALRVGDAALTRAQRDGHAWLEGHCRGARGRLLLAAGRLDDAVADAEAVLLLGGDAGAERSDFGAQHLLGRAAIHHGDAKRLRTATHRARNEHAHGDPATRAQAAWLLLLAAAGDGRPDEALTWLIGDDESADAACLTAIAHAPSLVRTAIAAGRPDMARAVVLRAEASAHANPSYDLLEGVAAHARGALDDDIDALLRAVTLLRGTGRPLVLAAAHEDLSAALLRADRRADAEQHLGAATALIEGCGAVADLRRLRRRLRALGLDRRGVLLPRPKDGWASLTESEIDVVRLVAAGHTNREVAHRLMLSRHTVSTHLRHSFVKLAIRSRVELARLVGEGELGETSVV